MEPKGGRVDDLDRVLNSQPSLLPFRRLEYSASCHSTSTYDLRSRYARVGTVTVRG